MSAKNRKDEKLIAALLISPTVKDAAAAVGMSESTVYKKLNDEAFDKKYAAARMSLLEQTTAYLQGMTAEAVDKIREIMNDPETPRQTALNAADCLLRNTYKMTEQTDIVNRISRLEELAERRVNEE